MKKTTNDIEFFQYGSEAMDVFILIAYFMKHYKEIYKEIENKY